MPENQSSVMAVSDLKTAGAITYWTCVNATDVSTLEENWIAAGLKTRDLPTLPRPASALSRAVHAQTERRLFPRILDDGGWALVREEVAGHEYLPIIHVHLNAVGGLRFSQPDGSPVPITCPECDHIEFDFQHALATLPASEFGAWLANMVAGVDGLKLRPTGGFYFIPRGGMERWAAIAQAVMASAAHTIFRIPALQVADVCQAVMASMAAEVAEEASKLEKDLDNPDLGARALRGRAGKCRDTANRVERFENLLGTSMESLREKLLTLQARLTEAALAQEDSLLTTALPMAPAALPGF